MNEKMRAAGLEVVNIVGTDRVDAGSVLAAGVLLTLVHIAVTEPALPTRRTGAGEGAKELLAGAVVETGGRVALSYVVLAEITLEPGQTGTVEGGVALRAAAAVLTGLGGAEALSDTARSGGGVSSVARGTGTGGRPSHHPALRVVRTADLGTAVLLAPGSGVAGGAETGGLPLGNLTSPAVAAVTNCGGAEVQRGLAGPACEATSAVAQKAARLV